jgi:tocopherol cyclase
MLAAYRRTGADPPFGDPRGYHGVGMEGHYWRLTQPATGAVVVAIVAISRDTRGRPWAMVSLAAHPGGAVRSATLPDAWAAPRGLRLRVPGAVEADENGLRIDLGDGANLHARFCAARPWPRRAFGALGPAHAVPGLSQYWHPWLLGARVDGVARVGRGAELDLTGAIAYAEKNWGAGGMPETWWWGQAHGFDRPDACVAFAGGRAGLGRLRTTAGALVVALGADVRAVVRPPWPLRIGVDERGFGLRGGGVEVEAHPDGTPPHLLPVPVPRERRRLDAWAAQHLTGVLALRVKRRGRTVYAGTSQLAGLERGRGHQAAG